MRIVYDEIRAQVFEFDFDYIQESGVFEALRKFIIFMGEFNLRYYTTSASFFCDSLGCA